MSEEDFKKILNYDAETGIFTRTASAFHKRMRGAIAGSIKRDGYIGIKIGNKLHAAHRVAWLISGRQILDGHEIDHIDGNKQNNKLANLRAVTRNVNMQNIRKPHSDSTSGFLGVSKNYLKWKAAINVDGKILNLGTFATPEMAHQAYVKAKRQHHAGCTI